MLTASWKGPFPIPRSRPASKSDIFSASQIPVSTLKPWKSYHVPGKDDLNHLTAKQYHLSSLHPAPQLTKYVSLTKKNWQFFFSFLVMTFARKVFCWASLWFHFKILIFAQNKTISWFWRRIGTTVENLKKIIFRASAASPDIFAIYTFIPKSPHKAPQTLFQLWVQQCSAEVDNNFLDIVLRFELNG